MGGAADGFDETRFHAQADATLACLLDTIDAAELDCVDDITLDDGVLSVKLETGGAFVVNKHYATKQIWYASPVSGALYFNPRMDGTWFSEARGADLIEILGSDLLKLCPESASVDLVACRAFKG